MSLVLITSQIAHASPPASQIVCTSSYVSNCLHLLFPPASMSPISCNRVLMVSPIACTSLPASLNCISDWYYLSLNHWVILFGWLASKSVPLFIKYEIIGVIGIQCDMTSSNNKNKMEHTSIRVSYQLISLKRSPLYIKKENERNRYTAYWMWDLTNEKHRKEHTHIQMKHFDCVKQTDFIFKMQTIVYSKHETNKCRAACEIRLIR